MTLKCVVHYKKCDRYSTIRTLTEQNKKRILQAKEIRESLATANTHHKEQCDSVPDVYNDEIHGIHLDPCYKRYRKLTLVGFIHGVFQK